MDEGRARVRREGTEEETREETQECSTLERNSPDQMQEHCKISSLSAEDDVGDLTLVPNESLGKDSEKLEASKESEQPSEQPESKEAALSQEEAKDLLRQLTSVFSSKLEVSDAGPIRCNRQLSRSTRTGTKTGWRWDHYHQGITNLTRELT